ncbi:MULTISPECIES: hypothetical protein [Pseudothermotoga]|uniref:Tfp pilus assembly protein ATPase PilM-like protein n=1 Tax=Pseudothermotoga lettingae (strain ATCC BAA-301 / DSM 14385 / NBRC 107922 / TMO) TaxID=416591 RepID=A8F4I5_PSELT|nr:MULTISPECIES: hypothetical protein [Pseudothermotoga]ABV33069.1 hypothetical protein Tlet_0502 [Pseudothermotoga lettingae TMO]MDI3494286.1 hypothetical protein [Pseudothermotoga sp.]MDK2884075.1 hypothetical protein [Pseudothermotoga sp.]GLI47929.1 hypothetical protein PLETTINGATMO_00980 [Pseudothermotoga lettingae TMO]HBJ82048.1 hypothetical protein [Pseudothermotoga sp.]
MQIFHKMITAIDITKRYVEVIRGRKSRGVLTLLDKFYQQGEDTSKILEQLAKKVNSDVEDIVAVNFPSENLLFFTIDIPGGLKMKDERDYTKTEISRLLNLSAQEIVVEPIRNPLNKALVIVAKQRDVNEAITKVVSAGFPEPDVMLPDIFKYLELVEIKNSSITTLIVLAPDYGAIILFMAQTPIGVRTFTYSSWEILDILREETGITAEDFMNNPAILKDNTSADSIIESVLVDLPYTVERETIFLLNTILPGTSIREISKFYLLFDPPILTEQSVKIFNSIDSFQNKIENVKLSVNPDKVGLGALGIFIRGGAEFGKNKLVQTQKTDS